MMGHPLIVRPSFFFLCRMGEGENYLDSKLSWQQYHGDTKQGRTFFTQSVITKVEITPFFMGILFIVF